MSLRNLCFITVLAAVVTVPSPKKVKVEFTPSDTRTPNSRNIETPPVAFVPVQSRNPKDLGLGKVLVSSRELGDPNFAETVILLVHYDAESVVGLTLNRRTHLPISRVLAQFETTKDLSDPVYLGGPVATPTIFALLHSTDKLEGAEEVLGGLYWISTKPALEKTISSRPKPGVFHVYLGYAGWTVDQLKTEVRLGGWFIFQADSQTVFNANPDSLWREMIKKTELKVAKHPTSVSP
jgi:putative transcriptional regulator